MIGPLCDYISDLPSLLPIRKQANLNEDYLNAMHSSLGVSIDKPKISFDDNIWDFNLYFVSHNKSRIRLRFEGFPEVIRNSIKLYAAHRLISGVQLETVEGELCRLITFFSIMKECYPNKDPYSFTNREINHVFDQWVGCKQRAKPLFSLYHLYTFIAVKEERKLRIDFKELNRQLKDARVKDRQAVGYRKTPNIPEEYARKIQRAALDVLRDNNAEYNMRMTAGYILLSMWTGLRTSELASIKRDALYSEKVNQGANEAYFIYYSCSKKSKTNNHEYYQTTFCPELAVEAFKTLVTLKKSNKFTNQCEYLFCFQTNSGSMLEAPICPSM